MRSKEPTVVVTFYTTSEAFEFASACEREAIEGCLMSVPRQLSATCGMAWRAPAVAETAIRSLVDSGEIECEEIHIVLM